jgi:hypothetical protein
MLHTSNWLHDTRERLDRACEEGERVIAESQQLRLKCDKLFERIVSKESPTGLNQRTVGLSSKVKAAVLSYPF